MFSSFPRRLFQGRPLNNGGVDLEHPGNNNMQRDPETCSHAPSPKKPCNRFGTTSEETMSNSRTKLCEVDNSEALISKIAALYAERLMSDITLVINGIEFPTHRLILCASSDVFQVMLMNPIWSESQQTKVELQETLECAALFEDFLKYLYTGSLKLTLANAMHLLTLADKYNVKDLIVLCLNYMQVHIPSAGNHNFLIQWYHYASNCGHDKVASACRDFIKWNFDDASKSQDFHHLDLELLTSILLDDDIVIYDEFTLFSCAERWIECQRRKIGEDLDEEEKVLRIVEEVMVCIRFPMMSIRQIADLILCPLTQRYKDTIMNNLALGMAFQTGRMDQISDLEQKHPYKDRLFTPRLYTTDKWSVCMNVDNFSQMSHYNSKTLVFSTPVSFADNDAEKQVEWVLDFYPKGVWFLKHYLIIWQGTKEIPECIMRTVRLSVLCKNEEEADVRVQIGILLTGSQDGVEHTIKCVRRNYIFAKNDRVNFDNLIPYGDLNKCASCSRFPPGSRQSNLNQPTSSASSSTFQFPTPNPSPCCCDSSQNGVGKSSYLVGPSQDNLKIKIIITPNRKFS